MRAASGGSSSRRIETLPGLGEMIKMSVLVVYASKHGATRGIAGRIAASLRTAGCQADVRPVKDAGDLAAYDAFVIGSAAYEAH
jgi:menaquinone-dependent protoporphyrinogen oxidase